MIIGVVMKLRPHAKCELLQIRNFFLVLHVLIEDFLVHGDFIDAARVGLEALGRQHSAELIT